MSVDERARWKQFADGRIKPLQSIKDSIRQIREGLDAQFPSWKASFESSRDAFLAHDARREYFVTLRSVLQHSQFGFIFTRDSLCSEAWWRSVIEEFNESDVVPVLREHALAIKFFAVHAIAMATEETCRAIARAGPRGLAIDPVKSSFQSLYSALLELSGCKQFEALFEVTRLTRNTIHTNGVYRPRNGKPQTVSYGGLTFTFDPGQVLSWMGDDFPEWLADQLSTAMECIIKSGAVSALPSCPRG